MTMGSLFSDPNFLQFLGNAGAALGSGKSVGEALNPSALINQAQFQGSAAPLLKRILEGELKPTPKGQEGPDEITTKTSADGTVTTIKAPSLENLNSSGNSVPLENQPAFKGGQETSPFVKALLGQWAV
jgi:hypothetical protein